MSDARVHDVRFSTYQGERQAPIRSLLVLARWTLLRAFGRRRGWGAKAIPIGIAALAFLPGLGVLAVRALLADRFDTSELPIDLLPYRDYLETIGALIVAWTALVVPELVCPDIRYRVTSLYFATAVSPRRYVLGKWLAAFTAMLGITLLPVLILFVGNVFFATSALDALRDDADQLPRIVGASLLVSVYYATLGLAIAAQTGRRAYAIGTFVGLVIASGVVSGVATEALGYERWGPALNLVALPVRLGRELFPADPEALAGGIDVAILPHAIAWTVVVACSALALALRFRKGDV